MKQKTFVLSVAKHFPQDHPRAGQPTDFRPRIIDAAGYTCLGPTKLHTARGNYEFWANRINEINKGRGVLSLRQWTGKPYATPQKEFLQLTEVGIQKIEITSLIKHKKPRPFVYVDGKQVDLDTFACNDGFDHTQDLLDWFPSQFSGALIHFTNFKY